MLNSTSLILIAKFWILRNPDVHTKRFQMICKSYILCLFSVCLQLVLARVLQAACWPAQLWARSVQVHSVSAQLRALIVAAGSRAVKAAVETLAPHGYLLVSTSFCL